MFYNGSDEYSSIGSAVSGVAEILAYIISFIVLGGIGLGILSFILWLFGC